MRSYCTVNGTAMFSGAARYRLFVMIVVSFSSLCPLCMRICIRIRRSEVLGDRDHLIY